MKGNDRPATGAVGLQGLLAYRLQVSSAGLLDRFGKKLRLHSLLRTSRGGDRLLMTAQPALHFSSFRIKLHGRRATRTGEAFRLLLFSLGIVGRGRHVCASPR